MKRRAFIRTAAAFAGAFAVPPFAADGKPSGGLEARFGVISDIHVTTDPGSCDEFEHALRYFDEMTCDGVVLCGDIADYGLREELKAAGNIWFKVFPGNRRSDGAPIEKLFIYGDHDMGGYMHMRVAERNRPESVIPLTDPAAAWGDAFREKWEPIQVKTVKGFTFILAHHPPHTPETAFGQRIPGVEEALARRAPKGTAPFFFCQHRIVKDTAGGRWAGGQEDGASRAALDKHPNVIAFCGQGHIESQDETCIWQDTFTAVEVPSLRYLGIRGGRENSRGHDDVPSKMMPMVNTGGGKQGLLMHVYGDRIVLDRRDFVNDCPVAGSWTIPLPFPSGKPYNHAACAAKEIAPEFPAGSAVTVRHRKAKDRAGAEHDAFDVLFPTVSATSETPRAFDYEVTAEIAQDDVTRRIRQKRVFSYNGHFSEKIDTQPIACVFARDELSAQAERIRFEVRPCGPFGRKGAPIVSEWEKCC
jgi:predicted phosphodiesterase